MSTSSDIMKQKTFWQQYGSLILILGGILVGALIGALAPSVGTAIKPIGDIFLNLLFTIVVPLVFVSIASAVGSMANMKRLGRILGGTIGTFIFTGAIASVCVLIWVNIFSPSAGTTIEMTSTEVGEAKSAAELIVTSLTVSDFPELWTKSNMLPLIIFSIIFGFCVSACGGDESPMGKLLINLNDIIMKFVGVIMTIAPLGLGAYFANLVATYGMSIIVAILSAFVLSGAPGSGLVGEMLIVSMFNFPAEAFPIIATLGFIFDPAATCLNSSGDTIASMIVTRLVEGKDWLAKATAAKKQAQA